MYGPKMGGGNKGYFIPGIILFYAIESSNNKKYKKLIYPTEFRLKTLKKLS